MQNAELRSLCERIAKLEADRAEIAEQIKEVKGAAKDNGFDVALVSKTVRLINMEAAKRKKALEQIELFDSYLSAAGLLDDGGGYDV
jgi:uncharacterized protein (UPF0335 family)